MAGDDEEVVVVVFDRDRAAKWYKGANPWMQSEFLNAMEACVSPGTLRRQALCFLLTRMLTASLHLYPHEVAQVVEDVADAVMKLARERR